MGLTIRLVGEDGSPIEELETELYCTEDDLCGNNFRILKYVDLYGDTTFNGAQIDDLVVDLGRLKDILNSQANLISQIIKLGETCKLTVHTYLKFYGD